MSQLTIAGIKACDSMKKAFARLDAAGVAYDFQDFKKVPPSAEQIATWLTHLPAGESSGHNLAPAGARGASIDR